MCETSKLDRFATLLLGPGARCVEYSPPRLVLQKRGTSITLRLDPELVHRFAEQEFLPLANDLVGSVVGDDASLSRALKLMARLFHWGKVQRAYILTRDQTVPPLLEKWAALIRGSFSAYNTDRLLVIVLRKKAAPITLAVKPATAS